MVGLGAGNWLWGVRTNGADGWGCGWPGRVLGARGKRLCRSVVCPRWVPQLTTSLTPCLASPRSVFPSSFCPLPFLPFIVLVIVMFVDIPFFYPLFPALCNVIFFLLFIFSSTISLFSFSRFPCPLPFILSLFPCPLLRHSFFTRFLLSSIISLFPFSLCPFPLPFLLPLFPSPLQCPFLFTLYFLVHYFPFPLLPISLSFALSFTPFFLLFVMSFSFYSSSSRPLFSFSSFPYFLVLCPFFPFGTCFCYASVPSSSFFPFLPILCHFPSLVLALVSRPLFPFLCPLFP